MYSATRSPLLPSAPDAITQVSTESEQNLSVSCLNHMLLAFTDDRQIQDSGSGFFANAQNILIADGTFQVVVSLSFLWAVVRTINNIFYLPEQ